MLTIITHIKKILNTNLFKSTGIYTATTIINASIPFFLMPILTRYLTPADYGLVSMFSVIVAFVTPLIGLNSEAAYTRHYYEKYRIDIRKYTFNCYLIFFSSTLFVSLIMYISADMIESWTKFPSEYLWMVIIVAIGNYITRFLLKTWQVQLKPVKYAVFQILLTITNAGLTICMVVLLEMAWMGRVEAQFYTFIIFSIIAVLIFLKNNWFVFEIDQSYIKHALIYGVPLLPHMIGSVIINLTDRFFITNMVGVSETGIYAVGYQIGSIINILTSSFDRAYQPWIFAQLKMNDQKLKIRIVKITYMYFIGILLFALFFSLNMSWFLKLYVGREFDGSSVFVVWVALGYAFQGMYMMMVKFILYAYRTYILAWITFLAAIVNGILNYVLIKLYGSIGAAYSTTFTYALQFIFVWILAARVYEMPWNLNKIKKNT